MTAPRPVTLAGVSLGASPHESSPVSPAPGDTSWPPPLPAGVPWRQLAACRGMDPELFFPGRGEATKPIRAVCDGCPVRVECAEDGMTEKYGVWGGLTERQRRRLRVQRRELAAEV